MYVELRHLRYFLAVAEELNFSRAAERLHVAQPALSAQIRALESQLGCELFFRTTRRVELTAHGKLLFDDAKEIVGRADAAFAKLRAATRGDSGQLNIGLFVHGAGEVGTEILRQFARQCPSIQTKFVSAATLESVQRDVYERVTDVAFAWLPILLPDLEFQPARAEQLFIGVSPDHPLAVHDSVRWRDVEPFPNVSPWDEVPFKVLEYWLEPFRKKREAHDISGRNHDECLAIASRGGGVVYCVPDSVTRFSPRPDLVFRPVVDVKPKHVGVVWHRETQNSAVLPFIEIARAVAGSGTYGAPDAEVAGQPDTTW